MTKAWDDVPSLFSDEFSFIFLFGACQILENTHVHTLSLFWVSHSSRGYQRISLAVHSSFSISPHTRTHAHTYTQSLFNSCLLQLFWFYAEMQRLFRNVLNEYKVKRKKLRKVESSIVFCRVWCTSGGTDESSSDLCLDVFVMVSLTSRAAYILIPACFAVSWNLILYSPVGSYFFASLSHNIGRWNAKHREIQLLSIRVHLRNERVDAAGLSPRRNWRLTSATFSSRVPL